MTRNYITRNRYYKPNHLRDRTLAVKKIWQKQAIAAINRKSPPPIGLAITYMVGFLTGMHSTQWLLGAIGAVTYILFYYLWLHLQNYLQKKF